MDEINWVPAGEQTSQKKKKKKGYKNMYYFVPFCCLDGNFIIICDCDNTTGCTPLKYELRRVYWSCNHDRINITRGSPKLPSSQNSKEWGTTSKHYINRNKMS
jgi:hypothetical protein